MTADLFGLELQTPRTNRRPEAAALVEVLKALRMHAAVAFMARDLRDVCEQLNN